MSKNRLEAFSDGVLAIIITIMVLELKVPHGIGAEALRELRPIFLSYVLSFIYIGIYWSNHHHLLHTVAQVRGGILWANLHLLFWLSLVPFLTTWLGEHPLAPLPVILYGVVLLMAGSAYWILQQVILRHHGPDSVLASALGRDWKGNLSPVLYLLAIFLAFRWPWASEAIYLLVALMWLVPDRRIERVLANEE